MSEVCVSENNRARFASSARPIFLL